MSGNERVVVVTGGGTGIGKAIAAKFLPAGDTVAISGRREQVLREAAAELQTGSSGTVYWHVCDVGNPEQVDGFTTWLTQNVAETIDVLVNNAGGIATLSDDASRAEAARYANETLSGNLVGTFLVQALGPRLRCPGGRCINLSSIAAFRGGGDIYSAAKAGVVGLTYSLAGSLGPQGITVNAVSPGVVLGTEFFGERMTEECRNRTVAQVPVGRPGRLEDIAEAAFYLASPAASYVNGEVLHVNGG